MVLQQMTAACAADDPLYFRSRGSVAWEDGTFVLDKDAILTTDTYYSAFSVGKWHTYCQPDRLRLVIAFRGHFLLQVMRAYPAGAAVRQELVGEREIHAAKEEEICIPLPQSEEGILFFMLRAWETGSVFFQARYECDDPFDRDITIALNICTYRREPYLLENLRILQETFLTDAGSPLYGHLKVFITDNGGTLDIPALSDENVHICYNPNVGGAGGFTRGLLEIAQRAEEEHITHVIFMDDDIELLPECLLRTYRMLRILKGEHHGAFIAGALLRLGRHHIQYENGALWNAGKIIALDREADLRSFRDVVRNEAAQSADYAAWWYCCVPVGVVRPENLPIPVFIHQDDVEYSLRNASRIITLNGIAVPHPFTEHKRISSNEYYNMRNMLIVNARYVPGYGRKQLVKKMFTSMLMVLLRFRYRDMHLIYQGLADFCKGPDWLLRLDAAAYHEKIQKRGYQLQDMRSRIKHCRAGKEGATVYAGSLRDILGTAKKEHALGRLLVQALTLNGWLLPAKKETYVFRMGVHPVRLFRMGKVVLYDDVSGQGLEVERSFRQIFVFLWLYLKALILICSRYDRSRKRYRERFGELQSLSYWSRVLKG